jgi:hypothetical protein
MAGLKFPLRDHHRPFRDTSGIMVFSECVMVVDTAPTPTLGKGGPKDLLARASLRR